MKQILLVVMVLMVFLIVGMGLFFDAPQSGNKFIDVYIISGMNSHKIADLLLEKGIINHRFNFLLLNRLFKTEGSLKAGLYRVKKGTPLIEVVLKISGGKAEFEGIKVTFPEGASIYKIGVILYEAGYKDWQDFQEINMGDIAALREKYPFLSSIPINSLEGYLYPDTYFIDTKSNPEDIADVMLTRFQEQIYAFWQEYKGESPLSLHQLLTLASIVEKEAKVPDERPIIASVFYNRLKIGMPLAADPTIKYALEQPTKKVYYNQLEIQSPYNTYKRYGLPPGPICNPGLDAFKAVLSPSQTNYLFFVAQPDGSHAFSKTWEEHQKAKQLIRNNY